jgi:integrase/recombinase XerC
MDDYVRLLGRRNRSEGTVRKYRWALERFGAAVDWRTADTAAIERFLDGIGGSPRYRAWWVSTLRAFYSWALDEELIERDPTRRLVLPTYDPGDARPVSEMDTAMALTLAGGPLRVAMALMAFAGLRCCEVSALQWADVDDERGCLYIVGKGGKTRMVPIGPRLAAMLPERGQLGDPVIGVQWAPDTTSTKVAKHLRSIGIDATAHQFRHRFGTAGYAELPDPFVLGQLMGHASPSTTRRYVRLANSRLFDMVRAIG